MRNIEERLAAVRQRAWEIEAKRKRGRDRAIRGLALAASLLLIVGLSFFVPAVLAAAPNTAYTQPGVTGSIFDISTSLGYILIGVLAFVLGVAVTILFHRIHARNKKDQDGDDGRAN